MALLFMTKRCHFALQENVRVLHIAERGRFPVQLIFNQNHNFHYLKEMTLY